MAEKREYVRYERDADAVVWVTIDRPEAANALNQGVREGLWNAFRRYEDDAAARVMILTGAGSKAFCAGGDLKEMDETGMRIPADDFMPHVGRNIDITKPVIAAVNGVALGGGFLLAQMADLCIAADHATFGITEARWGRGSPWAHPLAWLIPPRIALEMMMTAQPLEAERALAAGLVNRVVPHADLAGAAYDLARTVASNAPLTVKAARQMVYLGAEELFTSGFDRAEQLFEAVYESNDAQEGPRAFKEGRPPSWTGT